MTQSAISSAYFDHYSKTFREHGPNAAGVDWRIEEHAEIRYAMMLKVFDGVPRDKPISILDVGCGYGGLLDFSKRHGIALEYTGIDIVPEMVQHGRDRHPEARFIVGDFLTASDIQENDYVVCNGIMTLKLSASIIDMNQYCSALIRKMFSVCTVGIAFNMMTNRVNFMVENLSYRSPVEILSFCLSEISGKVRLDHAYPRYEFTTYAYR